MVDIDFQFRPVGQGAFYTGVFRLRNGKTFSFVYDCGTVSSNQYIAREISNFVRQLEGNQLDILFISHFHADHINKIRDLFNQVAGIKKVIIPYLSPEEIILAIADGLQNESGLDPDMAQLIENPVEFFGDKVQEIIVVHPGNGEETFSEELPDSPEPSSEINDFNFSLILKEKQDQQSSDSKVKHCYSDSYGILYGIWKFQMYNKPRDAQLVQAFLRDLRILIGSEPSYQTIVDFQQRNRVDFADLLQDLYSKHFGVGQHINDTSLVVNHYFLRRLILQPIYKKWLYPDLNGTLLTGDIVLEQSTINDLDSCWRNSGWKQKVLVFQIPHHGSRNNTQFILTDFYFTNWWIINFGLGNRYKHPHQQTIDHITSTKISGTIFCNTQLARFRYGGKLV